MSAAYFVNFTLSECGTDAEDRRYSAFVSEVSSLLGRKVDENGMVFDLYMDGCDAKEAAEEIAAC